MRVASMNLTPLRWFCFLTWVSLFTALCVDSLFTALCVLFLLLCVFSFYCFMCWFSFHCLVCWFSFHCLVCWFSFHCLVCWFSFHCFVCDSLFTALCVDSLSIVLCVDSLFTAKFTNFQDHFFKRPLHRLLRLSLHIKHCYFLIRINISQSIKLRSWLFSQVLELLLACQSYIKHQNSQTFKDLSQIIPVSQTEGLTSDRPFPPKF